MTKFEDPQFYGDHWADIYDDASKDRDPSTAVSFLANLADGGRVMELAIGTGRIALPLAAQGVHIEGIDASEAMITLLRRKPGGTQIPVVIGDISSTRMEGPFRLIFLAYNGLFLLPSQTQQVECFRNAARALEPGGKFVIECFVPDSSGFSHGQRIDTLAISEDSVAFQFAKDYPIQQRGYVQLVTLSRDKIDMRPTIFRYAWPAELDLMASHAGLELRERFSDWDKQPFGTGSSQHVSVYERRG